MNPKKPPVVETRGAAAFHKLTPRLLDIPDKDLAVVNVDVGATALAALGVAAHVTSTDLHPRFAHLAGPEFSLDHVDELEEVAWCAYYTSIEADKFRASSAGDTRTLPADLVRRATDVEGRMQKCCEYHFDDDPVLGPELARLRPGTSYRDLADDLLGYSAIYVSHLAVVEKDTRNYRPTDAAAAVSIAQEILVQLGLATSPEARVALDNLARAWTLLRTVYGEVRAAGLFLERADVAASERYPSLVGVTRAAPAAAVKPATPATPPTETAAPAAPAKTTY